ncbi:YebC/PmpR family DNA-binding transcriptional regulator [Candidatus Parcubacteria bacterium]|nr:MAG: YebC/PmpR family DNA-binding transcriptional regulator [Candidatus Parcubacteria bacterium]
MAGHSRWAQIKHQKSGTDAKRGVLFSKLGRIITIAARDGGPDPAMNPKLRQAVDQARAAGVPKDNIERAIQRAAGSADAANLRAMEYEAYGPGGAAFLIAALTDSPNRTTNEVKRLLDDHGGRLAETGSVAWMFERKIAIALPPPPATARDEFELFLIDGGAEAIEEDDDALHVLIAPDRSAAFIAHLTTRGAAPLSTALTAISKNPMTLSPADKTAAATLAAELEDHADVTDVWTNIAD